MPHTFITTPPSGPAVVVVPPTEENIPTTLSFRFEGEPGDDDIIIAPSHNNNHHNNNSHCRSSTHPAQHTTTTNNNNNNNRCISARPWIFAAVGLVMTITVVAVVVISENAILNRSVDRMVEDRAGILLQGGIDAIDTYNTKAKRINQATGLQIMKAGNSSTSPVEALASMNKTLYRIIALRTQEKYDLMGSVISIMGPPVPTNQYSTPQELGAHNTCPSFCRRPGGIDPLFTENAEFGLVRDHNVAVENEVDEYRYLYSYDNVNTTFTAAYRVNRTQLTAPSWSTSDIYDGSSTTPHAADTRNPSQLQHFTTDATPYRTSSSLVFNRNGSAFEGIWNPVVVTTTPLGRSYYYLLYRRAFIHPLNNLTIIVTKFVSAGAYQDILSHYVRSVGGDNGHLILVDGLVRVIGYNKDPYGDSRLANCTTNSVPGSVNRPCEQFFATSHPSAFVRGLFGQHGGLIMAKSDTIRQQWFEQDGIRYLLVVKAILDSGSTRVIATFSLREEDVLGTLKRDVIVIVTISAVVIAIGCLVLTVAGFASLLEASQTVVLVATLAERISRYDVDAADVAIAKAQSDRKCSSNAPRPMEQQFSIIINNLRAYRSFLPPAMLLDATASSSRHKKIKPGPKIIKPQSLLDNNNANDDDEENQEDSFSDFSEKPMDAFSTYNGSLLLVDVGNLPIATSSLYRVQVSLEDLIKTFLSRCIEIIEPYGGVIEVVLANQLLVSFNCHSHVMRHENVACRCAMELQRSLVAGEAWCFSRMNVAISVTSGSGLVGSAGSSLVKARMIAGEPIDLIRRLPALQRMLGVGVLATESTICGLEAPSTTRSVRPSTLLYVPVDIISPTWMQGNRTNEIIIYELLGDSSSSSLSSTLTTTATTTITSFPRMEGGVEGDYSSSDQQQQQQIQIQQKQEESQLRQQQLEEEVKIRTSAFTALYKNHDFKTCATLISKMAPELQAQFSSGRMDALCLATPPLLQRQLQHQQNISSSSKNRRNDAAISKYLSRRELPWEELEGTTFYHQHTADPAAFHCSVTTTINNSSTTTTNNNNASLSTSANHYTNNKGGNNNTNTSNMAMSVSALVRTLPPKHYYPLSKQTNRTTTPTTSPNPSSPIGTASISNHHQSFINNHHANNNASTTTTSVVAAAAASISSPTTAPPLLDIDLFIMGSETDVGKPPRGGPSSSPLVIRGGGGGGGSNSCDASRELPSDYTRRIVSRNGSNIVGGGGNVLSGGVGRTTSLRSGSSSGTGGGGAASGSMTIYHYAPSPHGGGGSNNSMACSISRLFEASYNHQSMILSSSNIVVEDGDGGGLINNSSISQSRYVVAMSGDKYYPSTQKINTKQHVSTSSTTTGTASKGPPPTTTTTTTTLALHETGGLVSMKSISLPDNNIDDGKNNGITIDALTGEVQLLSSLNHPNIASYVTCAVNAVDGEFYIMTEYLAAGSLKDLIRESLPHGLPLQLIIKYACEIAAGLHYLHTRTPSILHRDVRPENILMTSTGSCRLVNFGTSHIITNNNNSSAFSSSPHTTTTTTSPTTNVVVNTSTPTMHQDNTSSTITTTAPPTSSSQSLLGINQADVVVASSAFPYTAPEILAQHQGVGGGNIVHTPASDIYSLGITILQMFLHQNDDGGGLKPMNVNVNDPSIYTTTPPPAAATTSTSAASVEGGVTTTTVIVGTLPSKTSSTTINKNIHQHLIGPPHLAPLLTQCTAINPADRPTAKSLLTSLTQI